jgi:hypothetical protein
VFGNCVTDVVSGGFVVSSLNDAVIKTKIGSDLYVSGKARSIKLNSLARTGEAAADPFIIPGIYPIPFGA